MTKRSYPLLILIAQWSLLSVAMGFASAEPFVPKQDALPVAPPAGAVSLLDADGNCKFVSMAGGEINWTLQEGVLTSVDRPHIDHPNHIVSLLHFRDADLHVEFMLPERTDGNSGIYIHGHYELQIFNSLGTDELTFKEMGAIYKLHKPLVNATRPPGEWQVVDIRYRAPSRGKTGQITQEGSITAWLNGKKVQDEAHFGEPASQYHCYRFGATPYLDVIGKRQIQTMTGPVFLQEHLCPVRFRNVWVRPLDDAAFFYDPNSASNQPRDSLLTQ
jgi:hypothetical protein